MNKLLRDQSLMAGCCYQFPLLDSLSGIYTQSSPLSGQPETKGCPDLRFARNSGKNFQPL